MDMHTNYVANTMAIWRSRTTCNHHHNNLGQQNYKRKRR